jgi:hypothetical protein
MSGRELHRALQASGYADKHPLPSHATLQRRISGEHLANYGHLVDAIIDICTPAAQVESVRARARELQRKAWLTPTPVSSGTDTTEIDRLRVQVDRLSQLLETQRQLTRENIRRPMHREGAANDAAALIWLLAAAGRRMNSSQSVTDSGIEQRLRFAERERDEARQSLSEALIKIRRLEEMLTPEPVAEPAPSPLAPPHADLELTALRTELLRLDPEGSRFADAVRRALDSVLDGSRTGRFKWDQLNKTEKAMLGTRVEFEIQREFRLQPGHSLAFTLGETEFDLKYTRQPHRWMFDAEITGRIALAVAADDKSSTWSAGLIRIQPQLLNHSMNRDGKRTLSVEGRDAIQWLHRDQSLPGNVLVHLSAFDIEAIFSAASGQQRVAELLRRAQRTLISRNAVATVAMQDDAMKRVREARPKLANEGILVLSGSSSKDVETARRLGIPIPARGQLISTTE